MPTHYVVRGAVIGAILTATLFSSLAAIAASQCKGLSEASCAADVQCLWVDGYQRKDGRSVAAHCKSKPARNTDKVSLAEPKVGKSD